MGGGLPSSCLSVAALLFFFPLLIICTLARTNFVLFNTESFRLKSLPPPHVFDRIHTTLRVCTTQTAGGTPSQADISCMRPPGVRRDTPGAPCSVGDCVFSARFETPGARLYSQSPQRKECQKYPVVTLTPVMSSRTQIRAGDIAINTLLGWVTLKS